jgi:hypothetical protein
VPETCPTCSQDTLLVSTVAASRLGDPTSKTQVVHRVSCVAGCRLSERQVHDAGLMWSGDQRKQASPSDPGGTLPLGEDRCDVRHPAIPDAACVLHVGHGSDHQSTATSADAHQWA